MRMNYAASLSIQLCCILILCIQGNFGDDSIFNWFQSFSYQNQEATTKTTPIQSAADDVIWEPAPIEKRPKTTAPPARCESSLTVVSHQTVCKGQLIFEDNFDSLNESIWRHECREPLDTGDNEFVLYDGQATVQHGELEIKPIQWSAYKPDIDVRFGYLDLSTRCTGIHDRSQECRLQTGGQRILPPVVVPRINTRDSFNFKYGRIEIRAKLPQGDWITPLLLLEPLNEYYGQKGYESGVLRIAVARGNVRLDMTNGKTIDGRILYGGAVLFLDAERRDEFMTSTRGNVHFGSDYHVYSLTWTPEHISVEVDNKEYGQIPGGFSSVSSDDKALLNAWKRGTDMAPFDQPFYITLGISVGGFGDYPDNCRSGIHIKPWQNRHPKAKYNFWNSRGDWLPTWTNSELKVDYVRVYAL